MPNSSSDYCDCILQQILDNKKHDITIVEGNSKDHFVTETTRVADDPCKYDRSVKQHANITKRVWQASAPFEFDIDAMAPTVSARKSYIMRKFLNGQNVKNAKPKRPREPNHPPCNSPEHFPPTPSQKVLRFNQDYETVCKDNCPGNINVKLRIRK